MGSVAIVSEFFFIAVNSILYQRGIYQPETFKREAKYGLTVLTTTDEGLLSYLTQVISQIKIWLLEGEVNRLVVVVSGVDSGQTLERWQFNAFVQDRKNPELNKHISNDITENSYNHTCLDSENFECNTKNRNE